MKDHTNSENRDAVSGWEDDGGASRSDARPPTHNARAPHERRRSVQDRLDVGHQSDMRGEHRYDSVHQTRAEQKARQQRDELKQRLAGRVNRSA
jgi:hypothetical protein